MNARKRKTMGKIDDMIDDLLDFILSLEGGASTHNELTEHMNKIYHDARVIRIAQCERMSRQETREAHKASHSQGALEKKREAHERNKP